MSVEPKPPCILVVDDDAELAHMMELALRQAGFEAHSVYSGEDALQWIDARTPDAIILDLMMPDVNGFAILRHLRAHEVTRPLPVIVLTARSDRETREETQSAGVKTFLTKPVNPRVLADHVRQALAANGKR